MVTDKYIIRKNNEKMLLEQIFDSYAISRADLSKLTNLNKATTSEIIKDLLERGWLSETGTGDSTRVGGRKPIMVEINKAQACILAVDIGMNYIDHALCNLRGEFISYTHTLIEINQNNVLCEFDKIITATKVAASEFTNGLVGVTIGIHGTVKHNKVIFTPAYDLDQIEDLHTELESIAQVPVHLENEANLSAIGELTFSTNEKNLISLSLHSGIGAGLILDGKLYKGEVGDAGEVGHLTLFPRGERCTCGNYGCIELYASQTNILNQARKILKNTNLTIEELADKYRHMEPSVQKFLTEISEYWSILTNNLITTFSPQVIYFNSELLELLPELLEKVSDNLKPTFKKNIKISTSKLGAKATLSGGTSLAIQRYFGIDKLKLMSNKNGTVT